MAEWKEYKLGDIADITSAKRIFYSEYVPEGIPFYRSKEIIDKFNKREVQTELFISQERFNSIEQQFGVPKEDDILLTSVGTLGVPYLVKEQETFYFKDGNLTWFRKVDKNKIDVQYLFIWLQSKIGQQKLSEITIGSTQPALTISGLKEVEILLPDLSEQRSIASILSSLDDKIDLLHRQNKTLEALAETLFRQWFVEEAEEGWEIKTVSDIIEVRDGTHDSPKQTETGKYLITSRHLKPTGIDFSNAYRISESDFEEINKRSKVDEHDILFSMIGTLGLFHLVTDKPDYAIKNIGLFKSSQKPWFTKFLFLLLKSPIGRAFIYENAEGSTQEYIALGSLRNFEFKYPGEKRIKEFDEKVEPMFIKMMTNTLHIRTLTQLRDTLLPKLMSGEIRVKIN